MKKNLFCIAVYLLLSISAHSQGVSRMFGLVGGYPQANHSTNGFLFSTDSSGNNFQVQYNFPVTTFGANPVNLEMTPYNGKLYGTTSKGGEDNYGTIFEYDPATNIYTKKFDFGLTLSATGGTPKGSLLLYNNKFYGLAEGYGVYGNGVIFEWDPVTNIYTKKLDFTGITGAVKGSSPQNSLRLMNGKMYGTTLSGGSGPFGLGVVFEWDPVSNDYRTLLEVTGSGAGNNGQNFYSNVTCYNNKLYVMSQQGATNNYGALYVIDPALPNGSNTTIITEFNYSNGANGNNDEMIVYNDKLYGCTNGGGANARGVLFEVDPATNTYTKLVDFSSTTGDNPVGRLVANGTKFLGLCSNGGANYTGTVFEWDPANPTTIVKKYDFPVNNFDSPVQPRSTLVSFNSKFYGVTYESSFVNQGALFEYDYAANTIIKKLSFNAAENGRVPYGRPVLLNGKIYGTCSQGPQEIFGSAYGCLWEFDPSAAVYGRKFLFSRENNSDNGRNPVSSPIAYNGKLYGTTYYGGTIDRGVLYSFDPATGNYAKYSLRDIGGDFPVGEPALYNGKMYGMTNSNGSGNMGIIYSFDPATNTLTKLVDVQSSGSNTPSSAFRVYNGKLYGATSNGGANNAGGIIVYDPATNIAVTAASFATSQGYNIQNAPTLYNNKFYMTAINGGSARGAILMFDPATNALSSIYSFTANPNTGGIDPKGELTVSGNQLYLLTQETDNTTVNLLQLDPANNTVTVKNTYNTTNGNMPVPHNGLTVLSAFIANGLPNSCETYPTVVIDPSNNNKWVPILNNNGDVVAEIKANGNNLGNVNTSVYINSGAVREDGIHQLYLDRSITINVQNQPAGNVDIRLYIKTSEFLALKNAVNSNNQPSGISSIDDIAIFKNEQNCPSEITENAYKLTTASENYEYGYVLKASVSSFSTFSFAKNTFSVLPLQLISFNAQKQNKNIQLNWATENEQNVNNYQVEKSIDGINFSAMATVVARGDALQNNYNIADMNPYEGINYYRLKMISKSGEYSYSYIVKIDFNKKYSVTILPNPAKDYIIISSANAFKQLQIIDAAGKVVKQVNKRADNRYGLAGLNKGIYFIRLIGNDDVLISKIIIE